MPTSKSGKAKQAKPATDEAAEPARQDQPEALKYAWAEYRQWAAQSRKLKAQLVRWRIIVLALTVASAVFGLWAAQVGGTEQYDWTWFPKALGLTGAAAIGLAGYFGKEILSTDRERHWVQCRSMAEACKSESCKFATHTPPYNDDSRAMLLLEKIDDLKRTTAEIWSDPIDNEDRVRRLPCYPMEPTAYIEQRVKDQIGWYAKAANANNRIVDRGRYIGWALGAFGVALGAMTGFFEWAWPAALIAIIGTITASVASFLSSGRYQYHAISYRATGERLDSSQAKWSILSDADRTSEAFWSFVDECENTISVENSAWIVNWSNKEHVTTANP